MEPGKLDSTNVNYNSVPDTKVKEPDQIAFEFKLRDQSDWPWDFVVYIRSVVDLEKWALCKTSSGLRVTLPPRKLSVLQGWLELRGISSADEARFV